MTEMPKRCCVFCGATADSKEHVFVRRLYKRAGAVEYPVVAGLFLEGKGKMERPAHDIANVVVRRVCKPCNNGWMNDLEAWFEGNLGFLIEPQWPKLAVMMIESLKKEPHKLAQWMMKTAVMFSFAILQGEQRIEFAPKDTLKIKDGILPENIWVDLAFASYPTIGGAITRGFRVLNAGKYFPNQVLKNGDGFKFYVQFNHLLLRIGQAPQAKIFYACARDEYPVRIYPTPATKIPDNFAYEDIMKFEQAVILKTCKGCKGEFV
jgi:hypothetical protein